MGDRRVSISAVSAAFKAPMSVKGARRWALLILCEYADDEGYSYPKVSTIARRAGIDREETVREALRALEAEGYIERVINGWAGVRGQIPEGKRPNLYRIHISAEGNPTGPKVTRKAGKGATQKSGRGPTQKSGSHGSPKNGEQEPSIEEPSQENPPPTPSKEGATDGRLFEPGTKAAGASLRATKVRRHSAETAAMSASFAPFWSDYPGSAKSGKGSRIKGEEAWVRVLARGQDRNGEPVTTATYARRLGHYNDARRLFHEHWAALGVPDAWPKIINASTFINSKSKLFAEPWTIEDVADYWPAPDGREWTETKPRAPKLTRAEFQARVAASKETANNG